MKLLVISFASLFGVFTGDVTGGDAPTINETNVTVPNLQVEEELALADYPELEDKITEVDFIAFQPETEDLYLTETQWIPFFTNEF